MTSIQASVETRCSLKAMSILKACTQSELLETLIAAEMDRLSPEDRAFARRIYESEIAIAEHRAEVRRADEERRWNE